MQNILICESGSGAGGSSSYLYSFLQYLDKNKFRPIVLFSNKTEESFINKIKDLGVQVICIGDYQEYFHLKYSSIRLLKYCQLAYKILKENFKPIAQLIYIMKKEDIKLVLLNQDVVFHLPAVLSAALTRTPCVARKGGVGIFQSTRLWKFLARFPSAFVASSTAEFRFHVESGFPYKKMVVIFEGVDVQAFHPGAKGDKIRNEFGIPPDAPIISSISRIVMGKGHDDLIKAASLVLKEIPQTRFLIVGDGDKSLIKQLQEQVRSLGIQDKVIFSGWRKDTAEILMATDIFVHCPNLWREGMGIATLEALASGKPVVITNNWGLVDTTQDGYNGFIVPIGKIKSISEKIITLIENNELRYKMGTNSRTRALEFFDLNKNIKAIENVMKEVIC